MGVKPTPGLVARLRALVPWAIAAVLLAWLFHVVPLPALRDAAARASLPAFAAICIVHVLAALAADSFATWVTFRRALPGLALAYRETVALRAASYLLGVLHYGVGQGGLAYFLKRRHGVPLAAAAGAVMVTMGVNALLTAACAFLGVVIGGAPADPTLRGVVLALACGMPVYLAVVAARPRFLARLPLLRPIFDTGLSGTLVVSAARLPHIAVLILGNFVMMRVFGVRPGMGDALTLLPLVFVVATLPISPAGLGTAQAMAVALFAPYAEGATPEARNAAVLAYSLGFQFAGQIVQALVGLVFLRAVTRLDTLPPGDGAAPGDPAA